ncbi:histidine kinase [Clostridium carboxidivorans P7]|uniref:Stage 0 sporulation protein A homolog n=1 Tax=Clostridium carboxidivorans P7 TaxID=536227 RepID=C6PWQ3_9CLOT|nr:ATP-binding protein [Clostridium carboxidivorans]AKN29591.1 histidine kinase [Clostridium carboxidivorans P7]EET86341.1 response regulator receiver sensor signal transduction histidine kinase [Clostridium carboxidivorans P7]EFG89484.1 ATPase, histidine kinase-, DNA gyrase B-, and HSP90-like domain protein [Clostridium carboxidivorans P7]
MKNFKLVIHRVTFLIMLLIVSLALLGAFINKNREELNKRPVAKSGVLDLRDWNFKKQGIVKLDGQWEFYYKQLLTPEDFKVEQKVKKTGLINIPGSFKNYKFGNEKLNSQGYATYRLKVIVNDSEDLYAIKTQFIQAAHKLWVNDRIVVQCGEVGKTKSETDGKLATRLGSFYNNTNEFEIVLQSSNFQYGVPEIDSILLGSESQISEERAKKVGFDLFLFGITLAAAVYNFILFIRRKKDKAPLYFAVVCVLICLRTLLVGERLIYWVFSNMSYVINVKLLLWTFFLYIPVLILFMSNFYTELINEKVVKFSKILGIAYFFIILILPPVYYINLILPVEIISDFMILYIISKMLYMHIIKKSNNAIVIVAMIIFLGTRINDILYEYSVIDTGSYAPIGILIFIFAQSYVASDKFSMAFSKIEEMTERLKSVDKMKDDFFAATSHELKAPLDGIVGLSKSLIDCNSNQLGNDERETLILIKNSARRLSNLVNDILDFSKIKSNDINLIMKPVDIRQLINMVTKSFKSFMSNKSVEILNKVEESVPYVYGDENRIQQILYNLIGNAVKFTNEGQIEISAAEKGDYIFITIEDTGIGIDESDIYKIFQPYNQVEGINKQYHGSGLGLYVTKKLVQLHGGELEVKSTLGEGSEFTFNLPKLSMNIEKDNSIGELENYDCSENCNKKLEQCKSNGKILIVDDESVNIKVMKNFLSEEKYTVITAASGKEALNIAYSDKNIDMVILDMMLPDMIGWEVCSILREKYSLLDLPILIATWDNRTESLVLSFKNGANDYLRKPFEKSELLARVKTLIDLKHLAGEVTSLQGKVESTTKQVEELNEGFEENKKMLSQVIKNDKLKTEFFTNMSHELRTPLNVIWSTIQLIQSINANKLAAGYDMDKYLNIMSQNTLRLLRLINNLIDTTKIEGGYLSLKLANGNIISTIEEITLSAASHVQSQGIELIFDTEVEEKYMAFDGDKIERIMLNLLSNAIKFTEEGGSIFVNIYDLQDKVKISVKDTGIGIPEDKLDSIFDRFTQVDTSLSKKLEGSGIGLALVKSLVEMQKGRIYVKSTLGYGSEFIVELPAVTVKENEELDQNIKSKSFSRFIDKAKIEFSDIYHE